MSFYTIRIFRADLKDIKFPNLFKPVRKMCTFFGLFKAKTIMSHWFECVSYVFVTFMLSSTEVFSTSNNVTSEKNPGGNGRIHKKFQIDNNMIDRIHELRFRIKLRTLPWFVHAPLVSLNIINLSQIDLMVFI